MDNKKLHMRRCHMCGDVTHSEEFPITQCLHCGKAMAPFFYFDDEHKVVWTDFQLRPPRLEGEYHPILGLTVSWEGGS